MKLTGFAFVTFESEDTVDKVVDVHYHDINNKTVCITTAPSMSTVTITSGVETGGSGGSMNRSPELLGAAESEAKKIYSRRGHLSS